MVRLDIDLGFDVGIFPNFPSIVRSLVLVVMQIVKS